MVLMLFLLLQLPMPLLLYGPFYCDQYFNSCNRVKANKMEREAKRRRKISVSIHYLCCCCCCYCRFVPSRFSLFCFLSLIPCQINQILHFIASYGQTCSYKHISNRYKCWQGALWNAHCFSFVFCNRHFNCVDEMHVASIDCYEYGHQINEIVLFFRLTLWTGHSFQCIRLPQFLSHRVIIRCTNMSWILHHLQHWIKQWYSVAEFLWISRFIYVEICKSFSIINYRMNYSISLSHERKCIPVKHFGHWCCEQCTTVVCRLHVIQRNRLQYFNFHHFSAPCVALSLLAFFFLQK